MKNKLATNLTYQMLYQGLVFLYPLLTTPLISRAFGSEILGVYSYTYAIAYYFSLAAALGIANYGSRLIAMRRDEVEDVKRVFWELYTVQFTCSVITMLVYTLYAVTLGRRYLLPSLLQGFVIVAALADISWYFTGIEQFKTMVLRNCFIKIVSLVLIYFLVHTTDDLVIYILIMTITPIIGQLSIWPEAIRVVGPPRFIASGFEKHFSQVLRLFLPVIAINAYTVIDKTFLGNFRTMQEVGYYDNSEKLVRMPIGLVNAACAVLLSRASYFVSHGEKKKNNAYILNTLRYTLLIVIPVTVGLITIASKLVPWYLGDGFLPCIGVIEMLSPMIIFMAISSILRLQYFIPNQMDHIYTMSVVISAVVNLILNAALTKSFGVYGVVAGSVASEIAAAGYLIYHARKELSFKRLLLPCAVSALACIPMSWIAYQVGQVRSASFVTNILQAGAGVLVYAIPVAAWLFFTKRIESSSKNLKM